MKPHGLALACLVDGGFLGRARGACPDFFVLMPCMPFTQKASTSSSAEILLSTSEQNDCLYRVPGKAFELGKFWAQATDACCNSVLPHANLLLCSPWTQLAKGRLVQLALAPQPQCCSDPSAGCSAALQTHSSSSFPGIKTGCWYGPHFSLALP